MSAKTTTRIERLRSHAGQRNKSVDLAVVVLTELRAKVVRRVPR
jgi:hypothetical protein